VGNAITGAILAAGQVTSDLAAGTGATITVGVSDLSTLPADPLGWMVAGDPAEDLSNAWPVELRALPDLTLTPIDILINPNVNGDQKPLTVTVHNVGPVTATDVTLSAWSDGLAGTLIYSDTLSQVEPGLSTTETFSPTIEDGVTYLWFQIDAENTVEEADETNNLAVRGVPASTHTVYLPMVVRQE
jgi:hypothetical protein